MLGKGYLMSPPAWGWPAVYGYVKRHKGDVPTRVGMARDIQQTLYRMQ